MTSANDLSTIQVMLRRLLLLDSNTLYVVLLGLITSLLWWQRHRRAAFSEKATSKPFNPDLFEGRVQRLRDLFEGREAIYVEKGALHVKVSNIRGDLAEQFIAADVEEIPTAGFPTGSYRRPRHWTIGAGYLSDTSFSQHTWRGGAYAGWALFFDPRIVDGVVRLAQEFPDHLVFIDRYNAILRYLDRDADEQTQRVFEES